MRLYSGPLSLYSRKTEIALGEKGLAYERIEVPFTQNEGYQPKHPMVLAANPKAQVPVLEDGELVLYDSKIIIAYLEDAHPHPSLLPGDAVARGLARRWEMFADEVMIGALRGFMHRTEPGWMEVPRSLAAEARTGESGARLAGQLDAIERALAGGEYLVGAFSVADIAVFTSVLWGWRLAAFRMADRPALAAWYARLAARPVFAAVAAAILEADRRLSAPVAGAYG